MRELSRRSLLVWPVLLAAAGCSRQYLVTERGPQAYYQTGTPVRDVSGDLERIFRSVKRLQVTGYYRTYRFAERDSITAADVRSSATFGRATERFTFDHSKGGTATIIGLSAGRVTAITNDHVVALPDTVIVYFDEPDSAPARPSRYVESVSILTRRRNLLLGLPQPYDFMVLARDSVHDIAAVAVQLAGEEAVTAVTVLDVPLGDPARLAWASFAYVLGYPRGFRMVTRGIVSDPNRGGDHSFLLDGLFNRGISGGLILGVRGDSEALEWIGLATSASAQTENVLWPEPRGLNEEGLLAPYEGRLYIQRTARIDYGITFSVPVTTVQRFLREAGIPLMQPQPRAPIGR